jgi:hypothetical protein
MKPTFQALTEHLDTTEAYITALRDGLSLATLQS